MEVPFNGNMLIETIQNSVETKILTGQNGVEYATRPVQPLLSSEDNAFERELWRRKNQRQEEAEIAAIKLNAEKEAGNQESALLNTQIQIEELKRHQKQQIIKDEDAAQERERQKKLQAIKDEDEALERERRKRLQAIEDAKSKLPTPHCLEVASLVGVVDFLNYHKQESFHVTPEMIQIEAYNRVTLYSDIQKSGQRLEFCKAQCPGIKDSEFKYGQFYDQEIMIISLQSLFVYTPTVAALLKIIGNVKDITEAASKDDGFAQSVSVRAGIASVEEVNIPNPVILKPYRTFLEIDQPESNFVVRTRKGQRGPEFALFLADGGLWKLRAIQSIKDWFRDIQNLEIPVIG